MTVVINGNQRSRKEFPTNLYRKVVVMDVREGLSMQEVHYYKFPMEIGGKSCSRSWLSLVRVPTTFWWFGFGLNFCKYLVLEYCCIPTTFYKSGFEFSQKVRQISKNRSKSAPNNLSIQSQATPNGKSKFCLMQHDWKSQHWSPNWMLKLVLIFSNLQPIGQKKSKIQKNPPWKK